MKLKKTVANGGETPDLCKRLQEGRWASDSGKNLQEVPYFSTEKHEFLLDRKPTQEATFRFPSHTEKALRCIFGVLHDGISGFCCRRVSYSLGVMSSHVLQEWAGRKRKSWLKEGTATLNPLRSLLVPQKFMVILGNDATKLFGLLDTLIWAWLKIVYPYFQRFVIIRSPGHHRLVPSNVGIFPSSKVKRKGGDSK